MLALLMMGGLAGFSGFTPGLYAGLSDRQIIDVVFAERDKEGGVVPEWRLAARTRGEKTGDVREAARELPSAEELGIPPAAFRWGPPGSRKCVPVGFVLMWWQTWAGRGMTPEEILPKWEEYVGRYGMVFKG